MSGTLGLHISEAGIVAVIADAETDPTAATVVPLGASSPAAARAVAAGPDGTVLVGDAAAGPMTPEESTGCASIGAEPSLLGLLFGWFVWRRR